MCSGFARYLGVETWAVRLAAVTGLIFVPTLVLPAYIVAYFVMDTTPGIVLNGDAMKTKVGWARPNGLEQASFRDRKAPPFSRLRTRTGRCSIHRRGCIMGARRMLTHNRADLAQAELRLRRIESFVTSDTYELQKELKKMEQ